MAVSPPKQDQWFPLTVGSTLTGSSDTRFYTLRYDFVPASAARSQPASLHKDAENKVTISIPNSQPSKPPVSFCGNHEHCKDLDGIVFFDGQTLRLERLNRTIKNLKVVRADKRGVPSSKQGGLTAGAPSIATSNLVEESPSPPQIGNGNGAASDAAPNAGLKSTQDGDAVGNKEDNGAVAVAGGKTAKNPAKQAAGRKGAEARKRKAQQAQDAAALLASSEAENAAAAATSAAVVEESHAERDAKRQHSPGMGGGKDDVDILGGVDVDEEQGESVYELESVEASDDEEVDGKAQGNVAATSGGASSGSGSSGSSGSDSSSGSDDSGSDDDDESASDGDDI